MDISGNWGVPKPAHLSDCGFHFLALVLEISHYIYCMQSSCRALAEKGVWLVREEFRILKVLSCACEWMMWSI